MPGRWQITCINKTDRNNPHERIRAVGGKEEGGWTRTVDQIITLINQGNTFFVSVNGATVEIIIAEHLGHQYIKTERDGIHPNNLLALRECPK
jgi:hypothetical protein